MRPIRPRVSDDQNQLFSPEPALESVLKWIPVEVIAAYQFTIGVVPTTQATVQILLALIFTILTGAWIALATIESTSPQPIAWRQVILSTFAFAIWILGTRPTAIGAVAQWWQPWIGSIFLGIGWLLLPILNGFLARIGVSQGGSLG